MTLKLRTLPLVAALAAVVTVAPLSAQRGQMTAPRAAGQQSVSQQLSQQQMAAQQQMAQIDRTMQRLHQLEQQATTLAQTHAQRASQAAAGQNGAGLNGAGLNGAGLNGAGDQAMQQLCDSMANLAGDMTKTMDRIHQNLQDPALVQDKDMLKDMDRMRLHIEDMAGPLEDALNAMDRMQDRLHQPGSGK